MPLTATQEEPLEFWGSVLDYVELGRYPHRHAWFSHMPEDERIARAQLERLELTALAERALASLALVLTQQPTYYLLDEPPQHLDLCHQARVLQHFSRLAAAGRKAFLMVLHDPALGLRYCDHALLLYDDASALSGARHAVLTRDNLERLYRIAVTL